MTISITFPCGCEINEYAVLGMCVRHVFEMGERRKRDAKETKMQQDRFLKDVLSVMGTG